MIHLKRTDSTNKDFIKLVDHLDAELAIVDADDHKFYNQFNSIESLKHVVVAYKNDQPLGCGAIKHLNEVSSEIKRMFVSKQARGLGIATLILNELENWSKELNYNKCTLETGKRQVEAMALYKKCGYNIIDNYGQYIGIENSVCFEKVL